MWSGLVVVTPPALDYDLRIDPVPEPLEAQALVPELAVKALAGRVLPRLARIDKRCLDVGVAEPAQYDNSIGAATLGGFWRDPNFDPGQLAFYYVRVIEIPTPTFLAYDRKFYDLKDEMPKDATYFLQERAITSPIWYTP